MITIKPQKLLGEVRVVSSKSLSHRYVIAAALAEGESIIDNVLDSDDLVATKNALTQLGASIDDNRIIGSKIKIKQDVIDAHESGSTLRFLIPIAMLAEQVVEFVGKNKLPNRPLTAYDQLFKDTYTFNHPKHQSLPLQVKGPLKGGTYPLAANESSQFLTGLLFALPLAQNDSIIELTTPLESKGYVDLTLDVLKQFGIEIVDKENRYLIKGNQKYKPVHISVEGDYSAAAFFIVAGLIGHEITLKGLNETSLQGDRAIIDIVKQMGGNVAFNQGILIIKPSKTKGITIDIGQTPDLGPILMVLASVSEGITTITNAKRLRIKESDRLEAMIFNLKKLGVKLELMENDTLMIHGQSNLGGNVDLSSFKDHRIAMSMAIASIRCTDSVSIDDETVVAKSYPTFFEEFVKLGGKIS